MTGGHQEQTGGLWEGEPIEAGGLERAQDQVRWGVRATVGTLDFA